jgi:hypothetical protein
MLTRREAMPGIAAAAAMFALGRSIPAAGATANTSAGVLIIGGGPFTDDEAAGVAMGIEEAQHTAALLSKRVKWQTTTSGVAAIVTSRSIVTHECAFSLMPPEASLASRLDAWKRQHPAFPGARVEAWHPSLFKFGASELNTRFERFAHRPMTSGAWLGWSAVKAVTEAWLRDGSALCRALSELAFDGHKGEPLSFDASTGALRQPLYVVSGDAVVGVLP